MILDPSTIDWSDPAAAISRHFSVREACWLPSWGVMHQPSDAEKLNIVELAAIMDQVRDLFGRPIRVHVFIRPTSANCPNSQYHGKNYNALVGGALHSAHTLGKAADWDNGLSCDDVRVALEPKLEALGLRMEDNGLGANWIHLDTSPVPQGGHRYFKP